VICLNWWTLLLVALAAATVGFVLCFLWHWWLLSRPNTE
jgi:hypothetical protein